jgi:hypothetical protein
MVPMSMKSIVSLGSISSPPNITQIALFYFARLFLLAVIDEDQKHIGDDASVRFIPSSANTVHQPLTLRTLTA